MAARSTRLGVRILLYALSALMVAFMIVMRSWCVGTLPSCERNLMQMVADGVFKNSPLVDAEGLPRFLRYAHSPVGRYLHILPAGLWSIIAPMQLSSTLRRKYPTAHRWQGRLFIFMSFCIGVGTPFLVVSGTTEPWRKVGSHLILFMIPVAYFIFTAALAIHHARKKRLASHRLWVLRHLAMGYTVHVQRLLMILTIDFVPLLVADYNDLTEAAARVRYSIFKAYFVISAIISVISMELWLRYSPSSPRAPGTEKGE